MKNEGNIPKIILLWFFEHFCANYSRGAPDLVSGRIIQPDSGKIVLSGIRTDII